MTETERRPLSPGRTGDDERPPAYDVRDLVGVRGTAEILLDQKRYFLRITRTGKLILTK